MYSGMASNCVGASEVAKAVNALLDFSSSDQQALLEVIEDYFTSPDNADEDGIEDDSCIPGNTHSLQTNSLEGNVGLLYHSVG